MWKGETWNILKELIQLITYHLPTLVCFVVQWEFNEGPSIGRVKGHVTPKTILVPPDQNYLPNHSWWLQSPYGWWHRWFPSNECLQSMAWSCYIGETSGRAQKLVNLFRNIWQFSTPSVKNQDCLCEPKCKGGVEYATHWSVLRQPELS